MNSTSGFSNINSTQSYNSSDDNLNMNMNMNMNMNWVAAAREAANLPSISWPSSLLNPNLQMNSLLIKALQLGNYRPREAENTENYSFLPQGVPNYGTEFSSNFQASSSSKVLESLQQQQQQEQPFNLDSITWCSN